MLNILCTTLLPNFHPVNLQHYSCGHVIIVFLIRRKKHVDPDQMASSEAIWSRSTLFLNKDKSRFSRTTVLKGKASKKKSKWFLYHTNNPFKSLRWQTIWDTLFCQKIICVHNIFKILYHFLKQCRPRSAGFEWIPHLIMVYTFCY